MRCCRKRNCAISSARKPVRPRPEHLQVSGALPRNAGGAVRTEILQLVAMNQVELIDSLVAERERTRGRRAHRGRAAQSAGPFRVLARGHRSRPARRAPQRPLPPPLRHVDRAEADRSRAVPFASAAAAPAPPAGSGQDRCRRRRRADHAAAARCPRICRRISAKRGAQFRRRLRRRCPPDSRHSAAEFPAG